MKNKELNSLEIAEFLGWHMGDGCISITDRYSEYALTGDIVEEYPFYCDIVVPVFNRLFNSYLKKPGIFSPFPI